MKYSCSGCATGCRITVEELDGELKVDGNNCYAGKVEAKEAYKEQEEKPEDPKEGQPK